MRTRIYKIARNGMTGRKKDTLLLMIVIMMSFFFTILAIILQGSFQKTRDAQRLQLYGSWHGAYLAANDAVLQQLVQEPAISKIGKSYIFQTNSGAGTVGTYNKELVAMGEFNLLEGRFPESEGEIALESSKLAELGLNNPLGQKINLIFEFTLQKASREDMSKYSEKIARIIEEKVKADPEMSDRLTESSDIEQNWFIARLIREYRHRTIDWEYLENDITLTLSNLYYINYKEGEAPGPEEIREQGLMEESILRVNIPYTICGVISDYSERWDVSYYPIANSFITEEDGLRLESIIRNTKLTDNSDYNPGNNLNMFLVSDSEGENLYNSLAKKLLTKEEYERATGNSGYGELAGAVSATDIKFRKNNYAYPVLEGSTEATLLVIILTIIVIATIVSVFQIFLSQVKRRSRKIALLKSIGATNGQIVSLMVWEGLYLLICCLPAGIVEGTGISYIILFILKLFKGSVVTFYVDMQMIGLGLLAGVVSVIIGMLVPVLYAAGTPLVGTMSKPPKHNIRKYRRKLTAKHEANSTRQSFRSVSLRHISLNKGKTLLNLAISAITISILLISVFICYMAYADYNKAVAIPRRPDYTIEIPYGVDELYIIHYSSAIEKIPGIKNVQGYRRGENLHIYKKDLDKDELINAFYQLLPESLAAEHFAPGFMDGKAGGAKFGAEPVDNAILANMYGIDPASEWGKNVMNSITEGKLNKKAFADGGEVILLMPMYNKATKAAADNNIFSSSEDIAGLTNLRSYSRMKWLLEKEGAYKLSLSKRFRDIYQKNDNIKPGDTIVISADEEIQIGDSIITNFTPYEVKVGAVISYFPKDNIWPFSDTTESYAVIASSQLFEHIYKASDNGFASRSVSFDQMLAMFNTKFGKTVLHVYGNDRADRITTDTRMIEFANSLYADLYNYRESNRILNKGALNNTMIIGLLGFATSAVAIFILYNILVSTARQERQRTGILQSIGVTNKQLAALQITTGFLFSLVSIVLAHIIILLVMFLTPFGSAGDVSFTVFGYIRDVFRRLELYPWLIHFLVCIAFTLSTTIVYYMTSLRVIRQSPIENMRV